MADVATKDFLSHVKSLYPTSTGPDRIAEEIDNPWYIVAAVAFSASNRSDAVARVFEVVLSELQTLCASKEDKRRFVVKLREALFKSGIIGGYSRTISSLIVLYDVTPEELRETKPIRDVDSDRVSELISRGDELFTAMYGSTAGPVQSLLDKIHPDMGWFSKNIAYGHVYNALHVLGQRDTSYAIVSALIAMDTPRQIGWHLANCRRGGAGLEEVRAVRLIAIEVANACGVQWREGVPEVQNDA